MIHDQAPAALRRLNVGLLTAIVLACAVSMSPNTADPDLWGHVRYGKDALRHGLPAAATYTYAAVGYRWINHENLAELLLALGAEHLGPQGLLAIKCLLAVAVMGLIMRHAQADAGVVATSIVALLVSVNLAYHWSVRPQLLTYFYYTLMLCLLAYCFHGWQGAWRLSPTGAAADAAGGGFSYSLNRLRWLWLAPVLFLFWANSHGGFVAGYCIFAAYLFFRGVEAVAMRGRQSVGLLKRLALMAAVAGLATLLTPYSFHLHRWLLTTLALPRPEITEWHPPDLFSSLSIPLWLIVAAWISTLLLTRRSRDFTHLVILTLTLWQSLEHQRHIPFFALAFGFWMPRHVQSALARLGAARDEFGRGFSRRGRALATAGLAFSLVLLTVRLHARLADMPVKRQEFPVSAMQYIADHDLHGRMVVTYNWAQYAIAAFGPDEPDERGMLVGFDGRFRTCYPQQVIDMHFDLVLGDDPPILRRRSAQSPPCDGGRVLEYGKPDLVLINRHQPHSVQVMNQHRDRWVLLYQDQVAQLWGRAARYDDAESPEFIPPHERVIGDEPQVGSVSWPALPRRAVGDSR